MASDWPEGPDDPVDPALAPLIESGEGEAEGFEVAEGDLIEHAQHGDQHGTGPLWEDAASFGEAEDDDFDYDVYAEADEERTDPNW